MANSTFSGPIRTGTAIHGLSKSLGKLVGMQFFKWDVPNLLLTNPNGTTTALTTAAGTFDSSMWIPTGSIITDIYADVDVVYNQGTSAAITVGSAAAGTQYVTTIDIKGATGRIRPTFTAAQLLAMNSAVVDSTATTANNGVSTALVSMRITSVGTVASTGHGFLYVFYQQQ